MSTIESTEIDFQLIESWLREAGRMALEGRDSLIADSKEDGSLVTDVDRRIESYLYDKISRQYPDHQILAEEGARQHNTNEYLWTVDPIDGTRAYASGLPVWGISIGILRNHKPYAGYFFMPAIGELYAGMQDGAFLNHRVLSPVHTDGRLTPTAFLAVPSNAHRYFDISFGRLRSLGSATAHLAYVARGTALASLTRRLYIWDIAPVMPLLKTTGIAVKYLSGRDFDLHQLLDGSPSPEPLVAAPYAVIENMLASIHYKENTEKR
jgi:fructose-1,6-bisphosphatase/inositol monophosphatase family enzyme